MEMKEQQQRIREAADYIRKRLPPAEIGMVLGSGFGSMVHSVPEPRILSYFEIPHFPEPTVDGHAGHFVWGLLRGRPVYMLSGRFHYYEGHDPETVILPMRVLHALGVKSVILTNAAGGIDEDSSPGDLMVVTDHINLTGYNPLRGENAPEWGPRFPDMCYAYDREYRELALKIGEEQGIGLRQGVYCGLSGPNFETPAEIRMLRILGANAVGMSHVPEVLAARQMNMRVLAVSCITNLAAGILDQPLSHEEVNIASRNAETRFTTLLRAIVERMPL